MVVVELNLAGVLKIRSVVKLTDDSRLRFLVQYKYMLAVCMFKV